jgi:uncharacterized surface protein with fasciclin (FAS1) repeats
MKHICILKKIHWFFVASFLLLVSCEDKMADYYKEPEWLKGSIFQVLQDKGDYSTFLKGVELAGFKPIVNGKSILTVMAPNDAAFSTYLEENYGTGTKIEDLSTEELKKLIGFHVMYYAFNRSKLINFRPEEGDAATDEEKDVNAGLYYKHRTKSQDPITMELDTSGHYVFVYHLERFLPVFSYRMFQTKQIDAQSNYEYFYPETKWDGDAGFNVANAKVDDYSVLSDNGYIYLIDKVLKPVETIYKELSSNSEYSKFLALYDKYDYYQLNADLTLEYGDNIDLYQHYHTSPLPNIACEWPVTDYKAVSNLAYTAYSVFAPNNTALDNFFNDYWKAGGYDSLYEVSQSSILYLLYNCVYSSSIVFPEEITNGQIINSYGTAIKFDVDAVPAKNRIMCVNGSLYGCEELTPPAMFGSVTGPGFQYKKFSYFMNMLSNSEMVMTLCSDATKYIMLYPSNEVMNSDGVTMVNNVLYRGSTKIASSSQQNYVYASAVSLDGITGSYSELPTTSGSGDHVFRTLSPSLPLYWYTHNGKITNSFKFNEMLYTSGITEDDVFCDLEELTFRDGWSNGKCYSYSNKNKSFLFEGTLDNAAYSKFVPMMVANRTDETKLFYGFVQVLNIAGMLDIENQAINAMTESCLMFIPTTDAIKQAIINGSIPGITSTNTSVDEAGFFSNCTVTDATKLQYYLLKYFIPLSTATISNYPYVGWEETGSNLPTMQSYDVESANGKVTTYTTKMKITDNGSKLSVQTTDPDGNVSGTIDVISQYHYFPFVFNDGCVHFMEGVL